MRQLASAALIVMFSLLLTEGSLRVVDPWGLRYFDDVLHMSQVMFAADPVRGFALVDGEHHFSHWTATVTEGSRLVPDTQPGPCSLAFLGDSYTFGAGVNDSETWVNALARRLPAIQVINYGVPRYNAENVARTREAAPDHAAYLYLLFGNDSDPMYDPAGETVIQGYDLPWLVLYAQLALRRTLGNQAVQPDRVYGHLKRFLDSVRGYVIGFEADVLTEAVRAQGFPVYTVPLPDHPISVADFHLNPRGNVELAASLLPFVQDVVAARCDHLALATPEEIRSGPGIGLNIDQ